MSQPKLLVSVGIIFKNEIRCLERCLKSLQPLREAVPCEIVMADTGSDDGSREVAERYADIVFDFPWIDNFSAARNAVMDRCSGIWYMTIDADEWLDKDFSQLLDFFNNCEGKDYAAVTVRNYKSKQLEKGGRVSDFTAARLLRMSTGTRYSGLIHERWEAGDHIVMTLLERVILHHDGYVYEDSEFARQKNLRNMALLKQELAADPESLLLLMQCIESGGEETPEYTDYVYQAIQGIKERRMGWKVFGPSILRHCVMAATIKKLPELEEWIDLADELFPDSLFTKIDVQYLAMGNCWNKEEYAGAVRRGEAYFRGVADYEAGNYNRMDIVSSSLGMESPFWQQSARMFLAAAYLMEHQPEKCWTLMQELDVSIMDMKQVKDCVRDFTHLHGRSNIDTGKELLAFWEGVVAPVPSPEKAAERRREFLDIAMDVFHPAYRSGEMDEAGYCRHAYTVFLPLLGQENCELGTAAAILETEDRAELEKLLGMVENWDEFPVFALEHALLNNTRFPLSGKPLEIEKMDALAARMGRDDSPLVKLAILAAENMQPDWQSLAWARGLALAAVKTCDWGDPEQGMELSRAFAKIEGAFLPKYYAAELLCDENIQILPPLHRFGWYCSRAFRTLDAGDPAGYVRLLRKGLETCPEMKLMAEFLLKQLEESRKIQAIPELLSLAEQVRTLLSMYPADDPAVEALKQSAAYQKVVHLIEGPDLGVFGGLPQ